MVRMSVLASVLIAAACLLGASEAVAGETTFAFKGYIKMDVLSTN